MKLPPVPRLRVHQPKTQPENPCLVIMSSVLGRSCETQAPLLSGLSGSLALCLFLSFSF